MNKVGLIFSFLFAFVFSSCYKMPLNESCSQSIDAAALFEQNNVEWEMMEIETLYENSRTYSFENVDGIFCSLTMTDDGVKNAVFLSFYIRGSVTLDQIQRFNANELPNAINALGAIFGDADTVDGLAEEVSRRVSENEKGESIAPVFKKRNKDNHIDVVFTPLAKDENYYVISRVSIMNTPAYEAYMTGIANALKEEEGVRVVLGSLENIRQQPELPGFFESYANKFIPGNKEGYMVGDLIDDTGKTQVYLCPTSLNEIELKQTRKHFLYVYNNSENFAVILHSVRLD